MSAHAHIDPLTPSGFRPELSHRVDGHQSIYLKESCGEMRLSGAQGDVITPSVIKMNSPCAVYHLIYTS